MRTPTNDVRPDARVAPLEDRRRCPSAVPAYATALCAARAMSVVPPHATIDTSEGVDHATGTRPSGIKTEFSDSRSADAVRDRSRVVHVELTRTAILQGSRRCLLCHLAA
jgi:hypothetical protein